MVFSFSLYWPAGDHAQICLRCRDRDQTEAALMFGLEGREKPERVPGTIREQQRN